MAAQRLDPRSFLRQSLAATAAVLLLPLLAVLVEVALVEPNPPAMAISATGLLVSLATTIGGSALWMRRPASRELSFGELMLWSWYRRKRAEDQLDEGTRLLGLNRSGTVARGIQVTPQQQLEVLRDLSLALEAKDPYTHGHSRRVERHCYRTALVMGLNVNQIEELRMAAGLHDVGKVRVSDRVLRKPDVLTPEERSLMEEHVAVGAWMVSRVGSVDVIMGVRHHHERWDGGGYPDGLAGVAIPHYARVIAVADAYDAITSTRPYRPRATRDEAIRILKGEAGHQFDPEAVNAFLRTLPARRPIPVALTFALLFGGRRIGGQLAMVFKRIGAGSAASGATAAAAAVMIGAASLAPPAALSPREPIEEVLSAPAITVPEPERAAPQPKRKPQHKPKAKAEPVVLAETLVAPEPQPEPAPSQQPATAGADPQPEKGRDCIDNPGQGSGKGHTKHCG